MKIIPKKTLYSDGLPLLKTKSPIVRKSLGHPRVQSRMLQAATGPEAGGCLAEAEALEAAVACTLLPSAQAVAPGTEMA